jgi:hypothetical protein
MLHSPRIPVLAWPCIGWSMANLCFTLHENPTLAFPLHRVEYRSKPMLHSTRKPVDHDTDIYYLYNHVSSGNSSVARKVLATLTCEVIVQQLTTHNKHQFHDSQSSSHHTIQTLHVNSTADPWVNRVKPFHRQLQAALAPSDDAERWCQPDHNEVAYSCSDPAPDAARRLPRPSPPAALGVTSARHRVAGPSPSNFRSG